ncbi:MAG: class I SAM-dependent methyltransferase [Reyranella sp.]|uniref:class I SAM-dependent methyltransferase n=1 Tax=Reyranella sp. TaxID=1929291 RepID=UPI001ACB69B9|nr:class I SAM-dependent methyltransferase [Reyranella sp.]MBN9089669.1 class I SAM-dependent methyltransferase [Reyranella sp.]
MSLEQTVSQHYTHGNLEAALLAAVQRAGKNLETLTYADLAVVDEFHIGGRPATAALGEQIDLPASAKVLDVGCGIGGPARFFAAERGWQVEGIDLTAEYVEVAKALSKRVGMADKVSFRQASAGSLPFDAASFDGAYMIHVGMNIADKKPVFAGIRRVLKPSGVFAIYDAMRQSDGTFSYPVPWSSEPATNHIATPEAYKAALKEAGFEVVKERNRREAGLQSMQQRTGGPPVVMGETAVQKVGNMRALLEAGVFAPVELIARAV